MKIKTGDLVLCIDDKQDSHGDNPLKLGSIHYVIQREYVVDAIMLTNETTSLPDSYWFDANRFIEVKKTKLISLIIR